MGSNSPVLEVPGHVLDYLQNQPTLTLATASGAGTPAALLRTMGGSYGCGFSCGGEASSLPDSTNVTGPTTSPKSCAVSLTYQRYSGC